MNAEGVRLIFRRYVHGYITAEEAINQLVLRTSSLSRDIALMVLGFAAGLWVCAALLSRG